MLHLSEEPPFDTLQYSSRLEDVGFTHSQAKVSTELLVELLGKKMVNKQELKYESGLIMSQVSEFKKEITTQVNEFKKEMTTQVNEFKKEMTTQVNDLKKDMDTKIDALRSETNLGFEKINTKLAEQSHNTIKWMGLMLGIALALSKVAKVFGY